MRSLVTQFKTDSLNKEETERKIKIEENLKQKQLEEERALAQKELEDKITKAYNPHLYFQESKPILLKSSPIKAKGDATFKIFD